MSELLSKSIRVLASVPMDGLNAAMDGAVRCSGFPLRSWRELRKNAAAEVPPARMRTPFITFGLTAALAGQWMGDVSAGQVRTVLVIPEGTPAPMPIRRASPAPVLTNVPDAVAGLAPLQLSRVSLSGPYCSGFIRMSLIPPDLKVLAKVNGSGSVLATEGDFIYLSQGSRDGIAADSLYQVIRPTRMMERPTGRTRGERRLGMHYLQIAQVRVVITQPEFSLAQVIHNCDAVEVGDIAEPLVISEPPVEAGPRTFSPFMTATGDIKGVVVGTLSALLNFGSSFGTARALPGVSTGHLAFLEKGIADEGAIVYIDVGQRDAVRVGDLFIVYRQLQLNKDLYPYPREVRRIEGTRRAIGELIVVTVGERASTALVTFSDDTISAGDSVERR